MAIPDRRPTDVTSRQVKRILLMLAIGGIVIVGAASQVGLTYWRQYRHKTRFLESIQEVNGEEAEREQFKADARRLLLAGDFDGLEEMARDLRASRAASCLFASYYHDKDEAKAMLAALGSRMDTSVWRDRDQFAQAYHWATFEQGELAGGDPLARFFAWVMGS